jgi:hypothetical protein
MVTPELVARIGPVDTILAHMDLDGLYAAAKWILGGREPYPGADEDALRVDTRIGSPSPPAVSSTRRCARALPRRPLKHRVVRWLVGGLKIASTGR